MSWSLKNNFKFNKWLLKKISWTGNIANETFDQSRPEVALQWAFYKNQCLIECYGIENICKFTWKKIVKLRQKIPI